MTKPLVSSLLTRKWPLLSLDTSSFKVLWRYSSTVIITTSTSSSSSSVPRFEIQSWSWIFNLSDILFANLNRRKWVWRKNFIDRTFYFLLQFVRRWHSGAAICSPYVEWSIQHISSLSNVCALKHFFLHSMDGKFKCSNWIFFCSQKALKNILVGKSRCLRQEIKNHISRDRSEKRLFRHSGFFEGKQRETRANCLNSGRNYFGDGWEWKVAIVEKFFRMYPKTPCPKMPGDLKRLVKKRLVRKLLVRKRFVRKNLETVFPKRLATENSCIKGRQAFSD